MKESNSTSERPLWVFLGFLAVIIIAMLFAWEVRAQGHDAPSEVQATGGPVCLCNDSSPRTCWDSGGFVGDSCPGEVHETEVTLEFRADETGQAPSDVRRFRPSTRSTGGCPSYIQSEIGPGGVWESTDATGCIDEAVSCTECPECPETECPETECPECPEPRPPAGWSITVAQGLTLNPGRYRVLFGGSRAVFDVTGVLTKCQDPAGCVYKISRVSDVPVCPDVECPVGLPLQVRKKWPWPGSEENAELMEGVTVPGWLPKTGQGILSCVVTEVWE